MTHTCPECGQTCYCNGDWDDAIVDSGEAIANCTHCYPTEEDLGVGYEDESDNDGDYWY